MRTNRYELTSKKKAVKQAPIDPADLDALVDARMESPPPKPEQPPTQQQVIG